MKSESTYPGQTEYEAGQYEAAYPKLLPEAESGNAEAQCRLGAMYQLGLGVEVDEDQAIAWYRRAGEQGNGVANNNLAGILLMRGEKAESQRLYRLARAQGVIDSPSRS